MIRAIKLGWLAAAVGALAGCGGGGGGGGGSGTTATETIDYQVSAGALDVLFLVDDSNSMAGAQQRLAAGFPAYLAALQALPGGVPDLHIGVATSDMGASASNGVGPAIGSGEPGGCSGTGRDGKLQVPTGVALTGGAFLSDSAAGSGSGRATNYTGTLADNFQQMVLGVGVAGCGFEQHLAAIQHALDKNSDAAATNAGFLRADALLSIIILADEDDCSLADKKLIAGSDDPFGPLTSFRCTQYGITCDGSGATPAEMGEIGAKSACHSNETLGELTKVSGYVDFIRALKPDPQDVVVSVIAGPPTPVATEARPLSPGDAPIPALAHSCELTDAGGDIEVADPSVRQTQFLNGFPERSTFSTICDSDFSTGLVANAQLLASASGTSCFSGPLAVPYDCSVTIATPGMPPETASIVPECSATQSSTCWTIAADSAQCGSAGLALVVTRDGQPLIAGTHVTATCASELD